MPKPPAAFSPFATTKSILWSRFSAGSRSTTTSRPALPTMSPQNNRRMALPHLIHGGDHLGGDAREMMRGLLGHDPVQRLVIFVARHARHMLRGERHTDRERIAGAAGAQLVERAVIEPAAIAEPVALGIERQQRHDQHPRR